MSADIWDVCIAIAAAKKPDPSPVHKTGPELVGVLRDEEIDYPTIDLKTLTDPL